MWYMSNRCQVGNLGKCFENQHDFHKIFVFKRKHDFITHVVTQFPRFPTWERFDMYNIVLLLFRESKVVTIIFGYVLLVVKAFPNLGSRFDT